MQNTANYGPNAINEMVTATRTLCLLFGQNFSRVFVKSPMESALALTDKQGTRLLVCACTHHTRSYRNQARISSCLYLRCFDFHKVGAR